MKKNILAVMALSAALSACGSSDPQASNQGSESPEKAGTLYANPPFGSSDIDAAVEETRSRSAAAPLPAPANSTDADMRNLSAPVNDSNPKN